MRKSNPTIICDNFIKEIQELYNFFEIPFNSFKTNNSKDKYQSEICELFFHRAYVAFEVFISDYFIAAINKDSKNLILNRENSIKQSIKEKFGEFYANNVIFQNPKHLTVEQIETIVDSKGYNLTFNNCSLINNKANEILAPEYKNKFYNIDTCTKEVMDAAKCIRNCIAHQSNASFLEMNTTLRDMSNLGCNSQLNTRINAIKNIGSYLKSIPIQNGLMRIKIYFEAFIDYAGYLK